MAGTIVKCLYTFEAETDTDLSISVGDLIKVTNVVSDDWYEGVLNGRTGQFPKAFVENAKDIFDVGIAVSKFEGEQEGDLSLEEGDFVVITEVIDENWSKGYTHGGSAGVFPQNFVKLVSFEDSAMRAALQEVVPGLNSEPIMEEDHSGESYCDNVFTVVSPFNAQTEDELGLIVGARVYILQEIDNFWLEGKLDNGKQGMFPRTCVDYPDTTITSTDGKHEDSIEDSFASSREYVIAVYPYQSDIEGDLCFSQGDKILLLERIDDNWCKGELNGLSGLFPSNHVEVSSNDDESPGKLDNASKDQTVPKTTTSTVTATNTETTATKASESIDKPEIIEPKQPAVPETNVVENKLVKKTPPGRPNKGPSSRPPMGPKKTDVQGLAPPSQTTVTQTSPSTSPKMAKKKPPPPGRPKMPAVKKDSLPPFSHKFSTESQPTVIIAGRYVKPGEPHVIILRKSQEILAS